MGDNDLKIPRHMLLPWQHTHVPLVGFLLLAIVILPLTILISGHIQTMQQQAAAITPTPTTIPCNANQTFISAQGTSLTLQGNPLTLFGGSTYHGAWTSPSVTTYIDQEISLAQQAGINTLRAVNFLDGDYHYQDPVVWDNVDYLMQQAEKHNMNVILDLSTYRNNLRKQGKIPYYPSDYTGFLSFVGKRYSNETALAFYSIAGEPASPNSTNPPMVSTAALTDFYNQTSTMLYTADNGHHLISSGGLINLGPSSGIDWKSIFSLPHINIAAIHVYSTWDQQNAVPQVSAWAQTNAKPFIIEEFGFDQGNYTDTQRAAQFTTVYGLGLSHHASGISFWNLGTGGGFDVGQQTPAVFSVVKNFSSQFIPSPFPSSGNCPTPSPTGSPTPTPTAFPTGITPTDTPFPSTTLTPTDTPSSFISPSPTPTLGPAVGTLLLHFEGIDPQNNPQPAHPQRSVVLSFYSSENFTQSPIATLPVVVSFDTSDPNGSFVNTALDLSSIPQGSYYILAKSPEGSVQEELSSSLITIAPGLTIPLGSSTTPQTLRMGDLNGDNTINLIDYNILTDCYGEKHTSPACLAHHISDSYQSNFADLNDDGRVDGVDYNILLRNFQDNGI